MKFRVGPHLYRVRIARKLSDGAGPAFGLWDFENQAIWLDGEMPVRRRWHVLLHELKHAWRHAMGRPDDDEGDANQSASFAADVLRQLANQGGEMALMRLTEDGVVDHTAVAEEPGEPRAAQCPACNGLLNFPIRTAPAQFDPKWNRLVATRAADCDYCSRMVSWTEAVTTTGIPTGVVLSGPLLCALPA